MRIDSPRKVVFVILGIFLAMVLLRVALVQFQRAVVDSPLPPIFSNPQGAERRGMLFDADQMKRRRAAIAYYYDSASLTRRDIIDLLNYLVRFPEDDNQQAIVHALARVDKDAEFALVTLICASDTDNRLDKAASDKIVIAALIELSPGYQQAVREATGDSAPTVDCAILRQVFLDRALPLGQ